MEIDATQQTDREFASQVLRAEAGAVAQLQELLDDQFDQAVELILQCQSNVIISGMGKSGLIGQKISATLASTGTPSHFVHPSEALHGDIGRIRAGDVVVLLSHSGLTDDVLALAALLRQDRVPIIAICSSIDSHLGRLATVCLSIGFVTEACPHNLAPTASTTATLALGDALALTVSRRRHFSEDDFHKRHPGGMLGRQMMNVCEVLRFRVGENLPIIADDLSVRQVLQEAERQQPRRAGAVLLVDRDERLSGLFTDADLRRLLMRHGAAAFDMPMRDVMTKDPKCLDHTSTVRHAVQMVRELRVDELPVVDEAGRPIGLMDVQDLIALKVIED